MPINDFDRAHMSEIIRDSRGLDWGWFTCHLLRLIAKADTANRARIATAFPDEVEAYRAWQEGPVASSDGSTEA